MSKDIPVKIDSMAFKGYGVARVGGKVIFIPFTVTGDEGWAEIVEEKRDYSFGRLKKLMSPSSFRADPPCPYFGVCGGCQWQHIDYSVHGELKKQILKEILGKLGGMTEIPPISVVPSPDPYAYRVRIQLKAEGRAIGYYQERSHHVVRIDHCPISHPFVNQMIYLLRKDLSFFSRMEEIEINVSPEEVKGIFLLHPRSLPQNWKDPLEELLKGSNILKGCAVVTRNRIALVGDTLLHFTIPIRQDQGKGGLRLRTSPQSFFQVNLKQNEKLIETVLDFSEVKRSENVLDLYAGIGNFTLPLAAEAQEVVGIEENGAAVDDARFNSNQNSIQNCDFRHGRVEVLLKGETAFQPDLVVLDPPRKGGRDVIGPIAGLKPKRIVYTSCEPTTMARDLRLFREGGYHLHRLALIDMFPQAYHMEVVGLLRKG